MMLALWEPRCLHSKDFLNELLSRFSAIVGIKSAKFHNLFGPMEAHHEKRIYPFQLFLSYNYPQSPDLFRLWRHRRTRQEVIKTEL